MPAGESWPGTPALWAWKDAKRYTYEFSAIQYDATAVEQEAALAYLGYRYRQEHRESPLCSFGRFHRKYRAPVDGKNGSRGGNIPPGEPLNPAGGPSLSPLQVTGQPGEPGWMGLAWSPRRNLMTHTSGFVPLNQGYFIVFCAETGSILLIARSENCAQALFAISRNPWDDRELAYSFYCEQKPLAAHNFRERECDLIGNYIESGGSIPEFQGMVNGKQG
jgi:hypothetical protein